MYLVRQNCARNMVMVHAHVWCIQGPNLEGSAHVVSFLRYDDSMPGPYRRDILTVTYTAITRVTLHIQALAPEKSGVFHFGDTAYTMSLRRSGCTARKK